MSKNVAPMIVEVTPHMWSLFRLDEASCYEVALAGFYCGKGLEEISDLVSHPQGVEARSVVSLALDMGLGPFDRIIKG